MKAMLEPRMLAVSTQRSVLLVDLEVDALIFSPD
jgi:hypothetical protein